jgi:hypothetical protein
VRVRELLRMRGAALVLTFTLLLAGVARAQNPDTMDPDQSAAKGKQILKQLVEALGGQAYLGARSQECEGRRAQFGHNGQMMGYVDFKDYRVFPDKRRIDYGKKGNIIDMFVGDGGWTLDRGGVSEEPATSVTDYEESVKRDINNLLRNRLKEDRILIQYAGTSVVDLRFVDWVEVTDAEERKFRLAVDRSSHLLVRSIVITNDETTRERSEDVSVYTNYQPKEGLQLPQQITREKDGRRVAQTFYDNCHVNPDLPADFFTKAALEKRFKEVGGKAAKSFKNSKDAEKPGVD